MVYIVFMCIDLVSKFKNLDQYIRSPWRFFSSLLPMEQYCIFRLLDAWPYASKCAAIHRR